MLNLTIIICTKNSENNIKKVLDKCKNYKVILVDCSIDDTLAIARKYKNVYVVKDKGKGLAAARNAGLKHVVTEYVLFLGSDNLMTTDLYILSSHLHNYSCVSCMTIPNNAFKNYLEKQTYKRWQKKFPAGEQKIVGTPYIMRTSILKEYMYDSSMSHSDDTDLFKRMYDDGHRFYRSNVKVIDLTVNNLKEIKSRFIRYGISDREFAKKYKKGFLNFFYAFRAEWIGFDLVYMPYYLLVVFWRLYARVFS